MSSSAPLPLLRHPTLSGYYPQLLSLRDFLRSIVSRDEWNELDTLGERLAEEGDQGKRFDGLVVGIKKDGIVIGLEGGGWRLGSVLLEQGDLLNKVQATIARQNGKLSELSVLTAGMHRGGGVGNSMSVAPHLGRDGLEAQFANSQVVTILIEKEWLTLHEVLGTDLLHHILSSPLYAIYLPLPNNCYTQLTGQPLYMIEPLMKVEAREKKRKRKEEREKDIRKRREELKGGGKRRKVGKDGRRGEATAMAEDAMAVAATGQREAEQQASTTVRNVAPIPPARPPTEPFRRSASDVRILRNRMFYGKWGFKDNKRLPDVGLPTNHILNNIEIPMKKRLLPSSPSEIALIPTGHHDHNWDARALLRYIFPRAHGLHNVFTSSMEVEGDWRQTGKDRFGNWLTGNSSWGYRNYVDRTEEVELAVMAKEARTPKRMKGKMMETMKEIIRRHRECDYKKMRNRFCPSRVQVALHGHTYNGACSPGQVRRFVRAVCHAVVPDEVWESEANVKQVYDYIDDFVKARRFESLSVHQILQGFKVNDCDWIKAGKGGKCSLDEAQKRREHMEEMVFWLFDGFITPLIKTTFFVTEMAKTKYRTVYFRQDDWAKLCKPALKALKSSVYQRYENTQQITLRRNVPVHATIRLVPKPNGMRPICNLGRKQRKLNAAGDATFWPSINDSLVDPLQILTYEKRYHGKTLESSLFGLYDIYGKLKLYKERLLQSHPSLPKLYFVKVDVKSAFDSIDQDKMIRVIEEILGTPRDYVTRKHAELLPPSGRAAVLWKKQAFPKNEKRGFVDNASESAEKMHNAILVDQVDWDVKSRTGVKDTLLRHVTQTDIRLGRDYYNQSTGIPQGSKVSSLLCSFFYGHMERHRLKVARDPDCLLMRIIDDFLFITPDQAKADLFLRRMRRGFHDYGCFISLDKSLCNFEFDAGEGVKISTDAREFPYCGTLVDTQNLDLKIDVNRSIGLHVREALTVKTLKSQGENFAGWLKRMLENHNHMIYNDTSLSSYDAVVTNIYSNFCICAMKTVHYILELGCDVTMHSDFTYSAIMEAIKHTSNANRAHVSTRIGKENRAQCSVEDRTFVWLGQSALERVFRSRVAQYSQLRPVQERLAVDIGDRKCADLRRCERLRRLMKVTWSRVEMVTY